MDAELNDVMRGLCLAEGRMEQALFHAERAHRAAPENPGAMADYAALLAGVSHGSRIDEALPLIERALTLDPTNRQAHFALVAAHFTKARIADALAAARRALEVLPGDHDLTLKLVPGLMNLGLAHEAAPIAAGLLASNPDALHLAETLCTVLNYDHTASPTRVFDAHRNYGRLMTERVGTHTPPSLRPRGEAARLRLGIISPDLRLHSVGFFAEPILRHLDRARCDVFVYYTYPAADAVTARLRSYPSTWRDAARLPPDALAAMIRADRLDVLVELTGLTTGHSLLALALRPAPVQVTYLGYPATTGLPAIDARFVDSRTDPAPSADAFATERLVRLDPCFLCYSAPANAPDVAALPAARDGPFTFGSFNALTKINAGVLAAWARVLLAVPGSRLVVKARELNSPDCHAHLMSRLAHAGIEPSRVTVLPPPEGVAEHLDCYRLVDVALDTFPYCGTTTTCEALWMGVPVVTLAGDRHAARVGASLLSAVGLDDWITTDVDAYVARAARAAADVDALSRLRPGLRQRVAASPLCDGPGFAARFLAAIESLVPAQA